MEGDLSNARYWYREAGRAFPRQVSIQDEIRTLKESL